MDAPFFVRVNGTVGDYTLRIHKHLGLSFADAIALDPFDPLGQNQLHSPPATGPSTVHYSVIQHRLNNGAAQQLAFTTAKHADAQLALRLFDGNLNPIQATGYQAGTQTLQPTHGVVNGEQQRLFLTVDRLGCAAPSPCASAYSVRWTTNYRELRLQEAFVRGFEANRTRMFIRVDSGPEATVDLGVFNTEPMGRGLPANVTTIGFRDGVSIRFETNNGNGTTQTAVLGVNPFDGSLVFAVHRNGNEVGSITVPIVIRARVHN
jgi:hypothetical protein